MHNLFQLNKISRYLDPTKTNEIGNCMIFSTAKRLVGSRQRSNLRNTNHGAARVGRQVGRQAGVHERVGKGGAQLGAGQTGQTQAGVGRAQWRATGAAQAGHDAFWHLAKTVVVIRAARIVGRRALRVGRRGRLADGRAGFDALQCDNQMRICR